MRQLRIILIASLLIPWVQLSSQELIHKFSDSFSIASSDPLGNFYLIEEDQIIKTDSLGEILCSFSDPGLGNISNIDSSDPFRILLYYRSFNQLLFLDRTLSPIGDPVKLDELEIFSPLGICRSSRGGFWLIDSGSNSLKHINTKLEVQMDIRLSGLESTNNHDWFPLLERNERLYICRPGLNIMQFDLFGTQLKSIPVKTEGLSFYENKLLLFQEGKLLFYQDKPALISEPQELNLPDWKQLVISKNHALVKAQIGWQLYRLKKTL